VDFTGWRKPISNPGVGKVAWRYTALAALFFSAWLIGPGASRTADMAKTPVGYPGDRAIAAHGGYNHHTDSLARVTTSDPDAKR
jgi:hypothetical protein